MVKTCSFIITIEIKNKIRTALTLEVNRSHQIQHQFKSTTFKSSLNSVKSIGASQTLTFAGT